MGRSINRFIQNLFSPFDRELANSGSQGFSRPVDLLINRILSAVNNSLSFIFGLLFGFINNLIGSTSRLRNELTGFSFRRFEFIGSRFVGLQQLLFSFRRVLKAV